MSSLAGSLSARRLERSQTRMPTLAPQATKDMTTKAKELAEDAFNKARQARRNLQKQPSAARPPNSIDAGLIEGDASFDTSIPIAQGLRLAIAILEDVQCRLAQSKSSDNGRGEGLVPELSKAASRSRNLAEQTLKEASTQIELLTELTADHAGRWAQTAACNGGAFEMTKDVVNATVSTVMLMMRECSKADALSDAAAIAESDTRPLPAAATIRWRDATDRQQEKARNKTSSYDHLRIATCEFTTKLGEGGFGSVFKGTALLPSPMLVAVKRLEQDGVVGQLAGITGREQFDMEIFICENLCADVSHPNLLQLISWCTDGPMPCLIYEHINGGNLEDALQAPLTRVLPSAHRLSVLVDVASGLLHLHTALSHTALIHRDIRAANILLEYCDLDITNGRRSEHVRTPRGIISDFGLVKGIEFNRLLQMQMTSSGPVAVTERQEQVVRTSLLLGKFSHMAPEYLQHGQLSTKLDVFSFGVLMLETVSGVASQDLRMMPRVALRDGGVDALRSWLDPAIAWGTISDSGTLTPLHGLLLSCLDDLPGQRMDMRPILDRLTRLLSDEEQERSAINRAIEASLDMANEISGVDSALHSLQKQVQENNSTHTSGSDNVQLPNPGKLGASTVLANVSCPCLGAPYLRLVEFPGWRTPVIIDMLDVHSKTAMEADRLAHPNRHDSTLPRIGDAIVAIGGEPCSSFSSALLALQLPAARATIIDGKSPALSEMAAGAREAVLEMTVRRFRHTEQREAFVSMLSCLWQRDITARRDSMRLLFASVPSQQIQPVPTTVATASLVGFRLAAFCETVLQLPLVATVTSTELPVTAGDVVLAVNDTPCASIHEAAQQLEIAAKSQKHTRIALLRWTRRERGAKEAEKALAAMETAQDPAGSVAPAHPSRSEDQDDRSATKDKPGRHIKCNSHRGGDRRPETVIRAVAPVSSEDLLMHLLPQILGEDEMSGCSSGEELSPRLSGNEELSPRLSGGE